MRHTNLMWYGAWKETFVNRSKRIIHDALVRSYSYVEYKAKKDKMDHLIMFIQRKFRNRNVFRFTQELMVSHLWDKNLTKFEDMASRKNNPKMIEMF